MSCAGSFLFPWRLSLSVVTHTCNSHHIRHWGVTLVLISGTVWFLSNKVMHLCISIMGPCQLSPTTRRLVILVIGWYLTFTLTCVAVYRSGEESAAAIVVPIRQWPTHYRYHLGWYHSNASSWSVDFWQSNMNISWAKPAWHYISQSSNYSAVFMLL